MWITIERHDRLISELKWVNKELSKIQEERSEQHEKIKKLAELLGYGKKKKRIITHRYYPAGSYMDSETMRPGGKDTWAKEDRHETVDEFVKRVIAEDEEKQRLIKLAGEVEKGMKLKGKRK